MPRTAWYLVLAGAAYLLLRSLPVLAEIDPWSTVAVLVLGWAVLYVLACVLWPFAACRHCKGGRHMAPRSAGRAWRNCGHCGGTGKRIRAGRRLWEKQS